MALEIYKTGTTTHVKDTITGEVHSTNKDRELRTYPEGVIIMPDKSTTILNGFLIPLADLVDNFGATTPQELSEKLGENGFFKKGGGGVSGIEIVDNLTTEDSSKALSAKQGKILNDTVVENTSKRVSDTERLKWNNSLSEWLKDEILRPEMGMIPRVWNGSIWKFDGTFTDGEFITTDIETEISNGDWVELISTYPPVEYGVISPSSIKPGTTRWFQFNGSNIKKDDTYFYLGDKINVNGYQYISNVLMLVELTCEPISNLPTPINGIYSSIFPEIDNGITITLEEPFLISDGDLYIPGTVGSDWFPMNIDIIYTVGGWESQLSGARYIGSFGIEIPTASDAELSFLIHDTTNENEQFYFGFKHDPTDTGVTGSDGAYFRMYIENGTFGLQSSSSGFTPPNPIVGNTLALKRIMQSPTTCKIELYQNGEKFDETGVLNITDVWYPYFFTYTPNKVTNIELLIL